MNARRTPTHARIGLATAAGLLLVGLAAGCGYTTRGLYPDTLQTVSVPIFKNDGFRRDIEFHLTQQVIQTIEAKTPFKVVASADADTELQGTITSYYKAPFGEDGYDNPRGGQQTLAVNVIWIDKRSGQVIGQTQNAVPLLAQANYAIDVAQSQASAEDIACKQLANIIVGMMQAPW